MREGKFELVVASVNETFTGLRNFNEQIIGDHVYAVAVPGLEYCVKVNVYRDKDGIFSPQRLRIGLYVDGNDVQYWKRIDLTKSSLLPTDTDTPVCATFWGFKKDVTDIRSFKFDTPKTTAGTESSSYDTTDAKSLGQIHAVIYEAAVIGGTFENRNGIHDMPEVQRVSKDKKFWQQASLSTSAGRKLPDKVETFDPLEKWVNVRPLSDPLHTMTLFYHTESTLDCLKTALKNSVTCPTNSGELKRSISDSGDDLSKTKRNCTAAEAWDLTLDDDEEVTISTVIPPPTEHTKTESADITSNITVVEDAAAAGIIEIPLKYEDADEEILYIVHPPKEFEIIDISED